jgi:hypothetical protein
MTVKQLIDALEKLPHDATVFLSIEDQHAGIAPCKSADLEAVKGNRRDTQIAFDDDASGQPKHVVLTPEWWA